MIFKYVMIFLSVVITVLLIMGLSETISEPMYQSKTQTTTVHYGMSFPNAEYVQTVYTVSYGDTLTKIAERFKPDDMSTSEYVGYIMSENGIDDSRIYEGQKIMVWSEKND